MIVIHKLKVSGIHGEIRRPLCNGSKTGVLVHTWKRVTCKRCLAKRYPKTLDEVEQIKRNFEETKSFTPVEGVDWRKAQ